MSNFDYDLKHIDQAYFEVRRVTEGLAATDPIVAEQSRRFESVWASVCDEARMAWESMHVDLFLAEGGALGAAISSAVKRVG